MAASSRAEKIKKKVQGQGHKVILKITVARLLVKCVAAHIVGLHVDITAYAYAFHLLFTPLPPPPPSSGADCRVL